MKAIGIDLGTTNSVAAICEGEESPRTLPTSARESFTPSVVSFGKEVLVGRRAWNNAIAAPKDTIFSIKRLMGRTLDEKEVIEAQKHYPYTITQADDPDVRGVRVLANGRKYTPVDISAMILRQVVTDANQALGGEPVTHAVITVPAYFNEAQREATRNAGEQANLIIKKIIDEPTAAAIAFGMDPKRPDEKHTLLVFDMGGGTLDISILYVNNRQFVGMAITGDMWLGGDDFDRKIVEMITEWVKDRYDVDLSKDERFLMAARRKAEAAKHRLTEKEEASVIIPGIVPLPSGQTGSVGMTISRRAFEERIRPYLVESSELVLNVLKRENLDPEDISTVLLVGGATYVPIVRQTLVDLFGAEKVKHDVNPMEAVALGAAILAQELQGVECPKCKHINEYDAAKCKSCEASLSTARAVGGPGLYEPTPCGLGICAVDKRQGPDTFSVIIPRGTMYPLKDYIGRRYFTTGHQITVPVYEGDKPIASQNQYLGLVEHKLPADTPLRTPVWVRFNYDRNRILKVRIEVEGRSDLIYETTPRRQPDPTRVSDDKWRTALQNARAFAERMIEEYGEFISAEQKAALEDEMRRVRQALAGQDQAAGQQVLNELMHTVSDLGVASELFMAERMMHDVDGKTAQWLAEQTKSLRDACRAGDDFPVSRIRRALQTTIKSIYERMPAAQDIREAGGLLESSETEDSAAS